MSSFLPPPPVLGLPALFEHWRPDQIDAILTAIDHPARAVGLVMPTGSGKSLVYMAVHQLTEARMVVLTSTRGLQDQLNREFREIGLADVRGQAHYPCVSTREHGPLQRFGLTDPLLGSPIRRIELSVDHGPCHQGVPCPDKETLCPYFEAVRTAKRGSLVVTNYAYWLAHPDPKHFGKTDILVLDEAHHAPEALSLSLTITLKERDLRRLNVPWPHPYGTDWAGWTQETEILARDKLMKCLPPLTRGDLLNACVLSHLLDTLMALSVVDRDKWVLQETLGKRGRELTATPIVPAEWAERALFRGIPKILLTSATLTPKTLRLLGLDSRESVLWSCDHRVPVARRPVRHVPTIRVSHTTTPTETRGWLNRIDQIIAPRLHRKGIVHTVSYARRNLVLANSRYREHMVTHDGATSLAKTVQRFKKLPAPAILVSPSLVTGYDFPDDDCRYQIIGKLQIPDPRDPLVLARTEHDLEYAWHLALQAFVQAVGRGVRGPEDWCEAFIIDDHIGWMLQRYRHLVPVWFLQSFQQSVCIPAPL